MGQFFFNFSEPPVYLSVKRENEGTVAGIDSAGQASETWKLSWHSLGHNHSFPWEFRHIHPSRQTPWQANQAGSEKEALGHWGQTRKLQAETPSSEPSHANYMQRAMESEPGLSRGPGVQLMETPGVKSSCSPRLGGTTRPGEWPFVNFPALRHFSDVPGQVQGSACMHSFIYLMTTYYMSGSRDMALKEAGQLLGRRQILENYLTDQKGGHHRWSRGEDLLVGPNGEPALGCWRSAKPLRRDI